MASVWLSAEAELRAQPLRAWSKVQQDVVRRALAQVFEQWATDWGLTGDFAAFEPMRVLPMDSSAPADACEWTQAESGNWCAFLTVADRKSPLRASTAMQALQRALFGQAGELENARLAKETALAAWADIWERVGQMIGETALDTRQDVAKQSPPRAHRWSGAVRIEMPWCDGTLVFCLPQKEVDQMLRVRAPASLSAPLKQARRGGQASLREALAAQPLEVTVELASVNLSLGELQQLTLGDVVPLPHSLNLPLTVKAAHGEVLCMGWLGQRDGQLALELTRRAA